MGTAKQGFQIGTGVHRFFTIRQQNHLQTSKSSLLGRRSHPPPGRPCQAFGLNPTRMACDLLVLVKK
jgi:hypothetical protein